MGEKQEQGGASKRERERASHRLPCKPYFDPLIINVETTGITNATCGETCLLDRRNLDASEIAQLAAFACLSRSEKDMGNKHLLEQEVNHESTSIYL